MHLRLQSDLKTNWEFYKERSLKDEKHLWS